MPCKRYTFDSLEQKELSRVQKVAREYPLRGFLCCNEDDQEIIIAIVSKKPLDAEDKQIFGRVMNMFGLAIEAAEKARNLKL